MDLSGLNTTMAAEKGATLHLKHPVSNLPIYHDTDMVTGLRPVPEKGKELDNSRPMTMSGCGADSNRFKNIQADIVRKKSKEREPTQEEIEEYSLEQFARLIDTWTEFFIDGEPLLLNKENAIKVLREWDWIREQWANFVYKRTNFLSGA